MAAALGCDLHLNDTLRALKKSVTDFAQTHIAPIAKKIDETNQFPRELWPQLGRLGLLGITISKEYGGTKMGYLAQMIVMEAISRASASIGLAYAAHANLCANQIDRF